MMFYFIIFSLFLASAYFLYSQRHLFLSSDNSDSLPLATLAQQAAEEELEENFTFKFPDKAKYDEEKRATLLRHTGSADSSLSDLASTDVKPIRDSLIKRAIAAVEVAEALKKRIDREGASYQLQWQVDIVESGCRAVEEELKEIQTEADAVKPGFGKEILRYAASLTIGLKERKAARKAQEVEAEKKQRESVQQDRQAQMKAEQEAARAAKQADKVYEQLLQEEERKSKKNN